MKTKAAGWALCVLALAAGLSPLYGAEGRDARRAAPMEINLIIDGSAALSRVLDDVTGWISASLIDRQVQMGDRISIWNAGGRAELVYSDTLKDEAGRENVKKALAKLSAAGETADFAGALRQAAARGAGGGITYTLLVSASPAALSPVLSGPDAGMVRFSRIEEFPGWRAVVVALNVDARVRQAAAAFFSET